MIKKSKSKLALVGVALSLALFTTGCDSKNASAGEGQEKNQLVVAQGSDAVSLDPHGSNDSSSALVNVQIYETLVRQTEDLEIVPGLAESFEQIDERTYEFKLQKGVHFHNGEELKASDVEFTLLRALESANVSHIVAEIDPEGIEVVDDYTIRIATYEPYAPILAHLAHSASAILNEKAVTEAGDQYGQQPVGTGAFYLADASDWQVGDSITLTRFEDYHGDQPQYDELVIRAISEASNRTIGLETKEVDIAVDVQANDMERIDTNDHLNLLRGAKLSTSYIGFNTQKEPFNDVKVRQAISYAINSQQLIDTILEGVGTASKGPIGENVWGYNPDLEGYDYNIEKAKELLKEAGYEEGFKTTIYTNDSTERINIVTAVQSQLKKIGIDVEISILEWGTYLDTTAEGKHDMYILGWTTVTGDADYGLYSLFHSKEAGAAGNRSFFNNSRVDELLDAARKTADLEDRQAYYYEVQEIIEEEAPCVFITDGETLIGTQDNVQGFVINPNGHHRFADVYFGEAVTEEEVTE